MGESRAQVEKGEGAPGGSPEPSSSSERRPSTLVEVAARAGVSRQTVSNVLNAPGRVRPSTARRVISAIAELDYHPHRGARSLRSQRTGLIGYAVSEVEELEPQPLMDSFLRHVVWHALRAEHHILLCASPPAREGVQALESLVGTRTVDGFILTDTVPDDPRALFLASVHVPFVAFGQTPPATPQAWIDVDGQAGMEAAVSYLATRGHRLIAYVGLPEGVSPSTDRRAEGFRRGCARVGVEGRTDWVKTLSQVELEAAANRVLSAEPAVSAIVCVSDRVAQSVVQVARQRGIHVGPHAPDGVRRSVAVVGFNDTPEAAMAAPPLTTLRVPVDEIARDLVGMVVAQLAGERPPTKGSFVVPRLVERASA